MPLKLTLTLLWFLSSSINASELLRNTYQAQRTDGSSIIYHLLKNNTDKSAHTLLLILQGSSCNSVLNIDSITSQYRNVLPNSDLLLIEKYGLDEQLPYSDNPERNDCPYAYLLNDSPQTRLADTSIVLDKVKQEFGYKTIALLGGSEGAVIANLVAAQNTDIDAVITFNGGGRWFIDDIKHNIRSQYQNDVDAQKDINEFIGFSNYILSGAEKHITVSGHGYKWWHEMLSMDQLNTVKAISQPMLIIQAQADSNVSPSQVKSLQSSLIAKPNIEFKYYSGLDHKFKDSQGESQLPLVIKDMNTWLKTKL
ncbi:alpha/beta hydrolase [Pseudoalteromonas sp. A25]|uniref:alpha/beta hydrolase family protein n=1 Tax=Pseudoalteromonas sp. A25 TaxID=116092 RepID=UPI0012608441|nr:dienelactone hydrolase family protein [Pseudoalteromonas sp. A25]BBN81167.1 alpha/beta hydrolase [Pseudoalteromonas sp. A25]